MKNIKTLLLSFAALALLAQCQAPDNSYAGQVGTAEAVFLNASEVGLAFQQSKNVEFPIYLLGPLGSDVTVNVSAETLTDEQADELFPGLEAATEGVQFTLVSKQVVIPAGQIEGKVILNVSYEALGTNPLKAVTRLHVAINGVESQLQNSTAVELMQFCSFSGMQSYVGTYTFIDYDQDYITPLYSGTCTATWTTAMGDTLWIRGFDPDASLGEGELDFKVVMKHDIEGQYMPEVVDMMIWSWGAPYGDVWIKNAGPGRFSDCTKTIDIFYDPYFKTSSYWFGTHKVRAKFIKR